MYSAEPSERLLSSEGGLAESARGISYRAG